MTATNDMGISVRFIMDCGAMLVTEPLYNGQVRLTVAGEELVVGGDVPSFRLARWAYRTATGKHPATLDTRQLCKMENVIAAARGMTR